MTKRTVLSFGYILPALLTLGALVGCQLDKPASASFASVIIEGKTPDQMEQAATAVFGGAGYELIHGKDDLMFEKEGTRKNQLAYGSLLSDEPVRERVRAQIVPLAGNQFRLQCRAYVVRHPGDPFFEEEVRLPNYKGGSYQKLLDEVALRLK